MPPTPLEDICAEAHRIAEGITSQGLATFFLGGLAIYLSGSRANGLLVGRQYADIDLIAKGSATRDTADLLAALGYRADEEFNAINGRSRLLFEDPTHHRHVDVFVNDFELCHKVPVLEQAAAGALVPPLAELALTKLQIVEVNDKDLVDVVNLLHGHEVAEDDRKDCLDGTRIARLCAADWGLWRTVTKNLALLRSWQHGVDIDPAARQLVDTRAAAIEQLIQTEPKTRRWRVRSRIGERVRWYEEPEESH